MGKDGGSAERARIGERGKFLFDAAAVRLAAGSPVFVELVIRGRCRCPPRTSTVRQPMAARRPSVDSAEDVRTGAFAASGFGSEPLGSGSASLSCPHRPLREG